jgi:hypothetical protein
LCLLPATAGEDAATEADRQQENLNQNKIQVLFRNRVEKKKEVEIARG